MHPSAKLQNLIRFLTLAFLFLIRLYNTVYQSEGPLAKASKKMTFRFLTNMQGNSHTANYIVGSLQCTVASSAAIINCMSTDALASFIITSGISSVKLCTPIPFLLREYSISKA